MTTVKLVPRFMTSVSDKGLFVDGSRNVCLLLCSFQ